MVTELVAASPPSWGLDVPLATALCKTFLLRMPTTVEQAETQPGL
jgi:hypothetical protein